MNQLIGFAVVASCLAYVPCWAADNNGVLSALKRIDDEMSSGTVVFRNEFEAKDGFTSTDQDTLKYLPKGFVRQMTGTANGKPNSMTIKYDGQDEVLKIGNDYQVVPGKPAEAEPNAYLSRLSPGPSFALGRGLSKLSGLTVERRLGAVIVHGAGPDGTMITAQVDPSRQWLATVIDRTDHGKRIVHWVFGSPLRTKGGPLVASSSTMTAYLTNGKQILTSHYTVESADFHPPDINVAVSFPSGSSVLDTRLGNPVLINQNGSAPLSMDSLLEQTRQHTDLEAKQKQQDAEFSAARHQRRTVSTAVIVSLGATILLLGITLYIRRRNR